MCERRTARATALADSRLLELDAETLETMCVERPEIAIRIIRRLTDRLTEAEKRLSALGLDDWLRPKVRVLLDLCEPMADDSSAALIPGSLRVLADKAGLTMLEAHRALHELFDRKLVRLVDDSLIAPDVSAVAACLEAPGSAAAV